MLAGLVPRFLVETFQRIDRSRSSLYRVAVSAWEVRGDDIIDLANGDAGTNTEQPSRQTVTSVSGAGRFFYAAR